MKNKELIDLMQETGIKRYELALIADVDESTVTRWRNCSTKTPSLILVVLKMIKEGVIQVTDDFKINWNKASVLPINKFWLLLINHDWNYQHSDDQTVWSAGDRNNDLIQKYRKDSEQHERLYNDYLTYINGGNKPNLVEYMK